ncbi:hypothetical protein L484_014836 [Morus notabilis]|uniref:Uncharacterized protein n=1 Tax=Morus notabilis TaxID=981085 RepID=W9QEZ3_9ROSA|nr:hypothetical protein L484_014836 [Morus notabilis]
MPTFWLSALLKSLICKPNSSDSVNSAVSRRVNSLKMRKPILEAERSASFGCLSHLKDVIPGSKIHEGERPSSSGSKVNGSCTSSSKESSGRKVKGLLEHEGHNLEPRYELQRSLSDPSRKFHDGSVQRRSFSDQHSRKDHEGPTLVCQICGEQLNHPNAAESPCLPKHSGGMIKSLQLTILIIVDE